MVGLPARGKTYIAEKSNPLRLHAYNSSQVLAMAIHPDKVIQCRQLSTQNNTTLPIRRVL